MPIRQLLSVGRRLVLGSQHSSEALGTSSNRSRVNIAALPRNSCCHQALDEVVALGELIWVKFVVFSHDGGRQGKENSDRQEDLLVRRRVMW